MLTPGIDSCGDLLAKLERERYRAFHSVTKLHQADHFFNFCITAQALKDHVLEFLKATKSQERQYHSDWSSIPELAAVAEIANTAKHCVLRYKGSGKNKNVSTKSVSPATTTFLALEIDECSEIQEEEHPTIEVTLSDGRTLNLYGITSNVVGYWMDFFDQHDIARRHLEFEDKIDGFGNTPGADDLAG